MQVFLNRLATLNFRLNKFFILNYCVLFCLGLFVLLSNSREADADPSQRQFEIVLHQSVEIAIPHNVSAVVLANPEIADILLQSAASLVVSGKKVGITNLLLRDREQRTIADIELHIVPSEARAISVFNGSNRTDYSCLGSCQKTLSNPAEQDTSSTNTPPLNLPK